MPVNSDATQWEGYLDGYEAPKPYQPPEEDKKLAARLEEWKRQAKAFRQSYERTWELNHAFLKGDQAIGRHKLTGEVIRLSAEDSKRLKSQNNILRPIARSLIGKLSVLIPTFKVLPATADFAEQHGAKAGDLVMQYLRRTLDLDLKYAEKCTYMPDYGNAFSELCWDPLGGRTIGWCGECNYFTYEEELIGGGCPQCASQLQDQLMQQQMAQIQEAMVMGAPPPMEPPPPPEVPPEAVPPLLEANEGAPRVDVLHPMDVFVDPGALCIKDAAVVAARRPMLVADARRRYPEFAPFIQADSSFEIEQSTRSRVGLPEGTTSSPEYTDHVLVWRYHERPSDAYPRGRIITEINGMIVEEMASPYYKLGRPPVYHFKFDPVTGEFYGDAFITHAWHRQRELNLLESQMREHISQVLRPKLLNPIGSRIAADEFTSDGRQVIDYNGAAGNPTWQQVPDLPQGVWNRKADLLNDVRSEAAVTESEQGIMGTDPNGRAAAIINAEADQQIGPITMLANAEWKELYKGLLIIFMQFAHPQRVATIAGPEGVQTVSLEELSLLSDGWDLQMEQEEGLSRNPTVRLTQAQELAAVGGGAFFMDSQTGMFDKKAFARYAKLQVPDAGFDKEATERAAASRIPYDIMQGKPWQPRMFDDPMIFKEELEAWLRGPGRQVDPQLSMQVEQIWMYYTQWAMSGAPQMGGGMVGGMGPSMEGQVSGDPTQAQGVGDAANATVAEADQYGESLSQQATQHEG